MLCHYCMPGNNSSKVSSLQTFNQLALEYDSMLSHLFLVLSHRICDNDLLCLSLLPSICTAVHSHSHDSIVLTHIAEQIVNRFPSNLFACLSIISLSYCLCIYPFTYQILPFKKKEVKVLLIF